MNERREERLRYAQFRNGERAEESGKTAAQVQCKPTAAGCDHEPHQIREQRPTQRPAPWELK